MEVSGRGVGARWCLGEGTRGGGSAGEAEPGPEAPTRGSTAARPVIPLARSLASPLCPHPRTSSGSGSRPPHHPARA